MATRRSIYEAYGFKCNPAYNTFNNELSESECSKLKAILEKIISPDNKLSDKNTKTLKKIFK